MQMIMAPPLVWVYKKGTKRDEYHRKAIEESHYSQDLKAAIEADDVEPSVPVDLDEFGPISIVLPKYHSNGLHSNVRAGSIIFHLNTIGDYYAASLVLGTGRDRDRTFVNRLWPYDQPAKTYLVLTTQPVRIDFSETEFRELFGYGRDESPLSGQKTRYMIAPSGSHQNEFERNIDSYEKFFSSISSERDLQFDWVDRKSEVLEKFAQGWR